MHRVSIKILEIHLLLVFLAEIDTYRGSDSAAVRINFTRVPLVTLKQINTLY